jgi:hypothetical protein
MSMSGTVKDIQLVTSIKYKKMIVLETGISDMFQKKTARRIKRDALDRIAKHGNLHLGF